MIMIMLLINIEKLITINSKFNSLKYVMRILYQILRDYFKLYNVFINLQILFFLFFILNLINYII